MAYFGLRQIFGPSIRKKIREVRGEENLPERPPFVLAGNHVGFLDALALSAYVLDRYKKQPLFITTPLMWRIFGKHLARYWLGMIPIYRRRKKDSLIEAIKAIKENNIICIFPEGTRNPGKDLLKGKTGTVRIALETKVPIIPVGIVNNTGHRIGKTFCSLWQPKKFINFNFGSPIDLTEYNDVEIEKTVIEAATKKLMQAISRLSGKAYLF